jgi:hypothetical protein
VTSSGAQKTHSTFTDVFNNLRQTPTVSFGLPRRTDKVISIRTSTYDPHKARTSDIS